MKNGAMDFIVIKNSLLSMYCDMRLLGEARLLFDESSDLDLISWNVMVSGYGKSGNLNAARYLFDEMPEKNLVSWGAMIDACVRGGDYVEALRLFSRSQCEGVRPDIVMLVSTLKACGHAGSIRQGYWIHLYIEQNKLGSSDKGSNVILSTALVDMYCRCGCIDAAFDVFDQVTNKDIVLWNAMIGGLAMHGHGRRALEIFGRMMETGVMPNESTYMGVMCACSHGGMVDEGIEIFESMKTRGVEPQREHYGCLVDLMGRAGRIRRAEEVLLSMPMEPQAEQWGALMSACRMHREFDVGVRAGRHLIELEPHDAGRYVMLANVYAGTGRWKEAMDVRREMEEKGVKKERGWSLIEWNGRVEEFVAGDWRHQQRRKIYEVVGEMERRLEKVGYVKDTSEMVIDMDGEEEKGVAMSHHSEKLAMAFAILNIGEGVIVRIVKNLRVCRDCHNYTKLVSKVYGREIVVRDRSRFHHFKEGFCSCNDYW
ncbi:pentatricopeptide repeat-containing protein At5g06540-like [Phalaenopsis equestris]|uniref:pentatricopeptide repeat-containing protein At5g06540-like n=1 Tax=Phalaenopsis equestris TaxID=78828 RepID=UPI0009E638C7|nr:pentatricopeptide repeat-containing protein At5g06540-like [Phalaenopsis equestris]